MEHQAIEFHDSTVKAIRRAGANAILDMSVYVHSSEGHPGWDNGRGWYQDAELTLDEAEIQQQPENGVLGILDGSIRIGGQLFDNMLPLPCEAMGKVEILLSGHEGVLIGKGKGIQVKLKGEPGSVEEFGN